MQHFWRQFAKGTNTHFPKVIKDILQLCTIDQSTISENNDKVITDIETEVNKNKWVLRNSNYANVYEENEDFRFLFGHRLLLLSLPQKYKTFCENRKKEKKSKKLRALKLKCQLLSQSSAELCDEVNESETLDPQGVKQLLLNRLNNYAHNKLADKYKITELDVKKFKLKGVEGHCKVECPYCKKEQSCTFNSRWIISNFNKHVKSHLESHIIDEQTIVITVPSANEITSKIAEQPSEQRSDSFVLEQVNKIVR